MKTAAIIVAAGAGRRARQTIAKQLMPVAGKPLAAWSLGVFAAHPRIDAVILVTPPGETERYGEMLPGADVYVEGGDVRAASVASGLRAAQARDCTHVLIHDAARAGLTEDIVDALLDALSTHDAAAPSLPIVDALKRDDGARGGVLQTVDRNALYRIQTPQAFRLDLIMGQLGAGDHDFVDDLAAIEPLGIPVALVMGAERLFKVTHPDDFGRMERILKLDTLPRIGSGFDVHGFAPGDGVTLCGVCIPHTAQLAGHSDADVAWHALTDAILGALGAGDIGDHFPPTDPQWKGAASRIFLSRAADMVREAGFAIGNCDITVICEAPKVKPHREDMRALTADVLSIPIEKVSVKATTTEGLGFTGRGEGIAAQASVLLSPMPTGA